MRFGAQPRCLATHWPLREGELPGYLDLRIAGRADSHTRRRHGDLVVSPRTRGRVSLTARAASLLLSSSVYF
jgi:hypothetical protein